jgi:hypothetical protein
MSVVPLIIETSKEMENKMLNNNFTWNELIAVLKTKDGIASLAPEAYAFGLCFSQLNEKQKKQVAELVNKMEKKEDN